MRVMGTLTRRSKQGILQTFAGTESKKIYPVIHQYLSKHHAAHLPTIKGDGSL